MSPAARAAQIYDTEIENTIRDYAKPVLLAAGLNPEAIRIHLLRSDVPNAFVARGQRLFVTTGLLRTAENPGQVIGVLAHETGHIAGGHLARLDAMLRDASTPALLTNILAAALGALSGQGGVAAAASGAGNQYINRRLLAFSRVQERSADQAAIYYLDQTKQSAKGLLEFLEILDNQQALFISRRDQEALSYDVTHPLTRDRIAFIREQVAKSPYSNIPVPQRQVEEHDRMRAKLDGFLDPPARTLAKYKPSDRSVPARYARAIALYRKPDMEAALKEISGLIAEHPKDPYFRELKGQILFEGGRIAEALPDFEQAVAALPNAPLLRIGLAHAQIELNRPELNKAAIENLEAAIKQDNVIPIAWRLAATAYGRDNQLGESALASAEFALLTGNGRDARQMAERAKHTFKRGSSGWLRAEDLLATMKPERDGR